MEIVINTRPARPDELDIVNYLLTSEGFDSVENVDGITIAVNENDELVGFVRVQVCPDEYAYIYPVIVFEEWRAYGVGKRLTQETIDTYGKVKLVSRGWVNGFYESLGFTKAAWEDIDKEIAADCDLCEMYEECNPQPYRYERSSS